MDIIELIFKAVSLVIGVMVYLIYQEMKKVNGNCDNYFKSREHRKLKKKKKKNIVQSQYHLHGQIKLKVKRNINLIIGILLWHLFSSRKNFLLRHSRFTA